MRIILSSCDQIYRSAPCCHSDGRDCYCYSCLHSSFYSPTPDTYQCQKKICYYIMNYGPAYSSEVYHYLSESQILENNFNCQSMNILSLGCGFSPDLVAIERYITDNNLNITFNYLGLDNSPHWSSLGIAHPYAQYYLQDVLSGFKFSGYDIIFINKLYSTLKKNGQHSQFVITDLIPSQIRRDKREPLPPVLPSQSYYSRL